MDAYVYRGSFYCTDCAQELINVMDEFHMARPDGNSDNYPQGPYPNGGGEADVPNHCDRCGDFLYNPLTTDGVNYVSQTLADYEEGLPGVYETLEEWREYYFPDHEPLRKHPI